MRSQCSRPPRRQPAAPLRLPAVARGLERRRAQRRGATAIEYCFLLSLVFLAILLAVQHLGGVLKDSFNHSNTKLTAVGL